jgi:DNA-binding GntR family transcriptional regulator
MRTQKPTASASVSHLAGRPADGKPLGERVYGLIKQDICTCVLAPGSSFSEAQLAARYRVSKAPVRWALTALSRERLVTASPRQGYTVAPITLQSIHELFDIRIILEPAAVRLPAQRIDAAGLARLERLNRIVHKKYVPGDRKTQGATFDANKGFHVEIARASGNDRLTRLIESTFDEAGRIFHLWLTVMDGTQFKSADHRTLIEMLAARRGDDAAKLATTHIENARDVMMQAVMGSTAILQTNIAVA